MTEPEEQAIRRQQWNVDRLKQELGQKQTVLSNLQSEYEELCISMTEKDHLQEELDALSMAGRRSRVSPYRCRAGSATA